MENELKLIRQDGIFYILYNGEKIEITQNEAVAISQDHSLVYDVLVTHKRKFNFNTTEDNYGLF